MAKGDVGVVLKLDDVLLTEKLLLEVVEDAVVTDEVVGVVDDLGEHDDTRHQGDNELDHHNDPHRLHSAELCFDTSQQSWWLSTGLHGFH